jgi:hypothetical protein
MNQQVLNSFNFVEIMNYVWTIAPRPFKSENGPTKRNTDTTTA